MNRTRSSEFPNDNPSLHDGAIWICLGPCSRPRAIVRPQPVLEPEPEPEPELATELEIQPEPAPAAAEADALPAPAPAPEPDAYADLIGVIARIALESGATRAAAVLPALLSGEAVTVEMVGEENLTCLVARGFAERAGSIVLLSAGASATAAGFRAMLRGEDANLGECESTLDNWCAGLLAAAAGTPARAEELRRELRRLGVAAFGLLAQAA